MSTKVGAQFEISAIDKTQQAFASVEGSIKDLKESIGKIGTLAGLGGLLGIGTGFELVREAATELFKEVSANEDAFNELTAEVKATGDACGYSVDQLQQFAHQLEHTSTQSYASVQKMEVVLQGFTNITGQNFKDAAQFALDYATATGQSLDEVAKTVGEALNDPIKGIRTLRSLGVDLTAEQREQVIAFVQSGQAAKAQAIEIQALQHSYSGLAEAATKSMGGQVSQEWHKFIDWITGDSGTDLDDKIKETTADLQQLKNTLVLSQSDAKFSGSFEDPAAIQKEIDQKTQLLQLYQKQKNAESEPQQKPSGPDGATVVKEKDEVDKLVTSLKQETATYGMTGEAVMKYRVTVGDLAQSIKDLGTVTGAADAKRLIALAHQKDLDEESKKAEEARKEAAKSVQEMIASLDKETATYGGNKEAVMRYEVAHGELAEKLKAMGPAGAAAADQLVALARKEDQLKDSAEKAQEALDAQNDKMQRATQLIEKVNPQQKVADTEASMQDLVGVTVNGVTVTKEMVEQYALLGEKGKDTNDQLTAFGQEAAKNIQDDFAQYLFAPFDGGLKGMVLSFAKTLEKMLDQIIAAQLMDKLFGGFDSSGKGNGSSGLADVISKGMQSFFGGGHADGGDVSPNQFYLVGEQGPELFAPKSAGSIIPNAATMGAMSGGGGSNGPLVNIDARGAGPTEVAKLLSFGKQLESSIKGQVEYRIQRGSWTNNR